jgi:DNA-binding CsgD family transcriptional regulator/tetratricopeptide (TPR) repeat protein
MARRSQYPLRGRDRQLEVVAAHLDRVRAGIGDVMIVEGGAGLGKTSLLVEAMSTATAMSFRAALGREEPGHSVVDMAALMEALFGGEQPLIARNALRAPDGREEWFWLLQDIQSLLERAASEQPLLICLDDMHWAKAGCGFALRTLPRSLASLPIAWMVAARADQGSPQIQRAVGELVDSGAEVLRLEPLDDEAVAQVATDVLGVRPDAAVLRAASRVQGNPFLLVDLLSGLQEDGLVATDGGCATLIEDRVPQRLGDSMRRRLARMSPAADRVATLAASLARQFSLQHLAALGGYSVTDLLEPVRELIDADIFSEHGDRLTFRHDLIREAVRAGSPSAVRRALDREAAAVLLASGAVPVEVALQLASSAEPGDEDAITTLFEAAEALGIADPSASADIAGRALELTPARHARRGPLVARRALSLFAAGRGEEAKAFADSALRQHLPAEQEAQVRLSIAGMFVLSPDVRADNVRRALALAETSMDLRARLWASLFFNLVVAQRTDEALALAQKVERAVPASTDKAANYVFEITGSTIEYQLGRFEQSLERLDDVERRYVNVDDARERLAHNFRSWLLAALDRSDEALEHASDGLASAQRDRQNWAIQLFETWRGRQFLQLGRLDDASAALEGRFHLSDAHRVVGVLDAASVVALGRVKIHMADQRAAGEVAEIAKVMLGTTAPGVRRHGAWFLALHAMAAGNPHEAHNWLCAMGKEERLSIFPLFPLEVADDVQLARIALAAGDDDLARRATVLAQHRHELNPTVRSIEAIAAHAHGLLVGSTEDLERAVSLLDGGSRPLALSSALEDLGRARVAAGDEGGAVEVFDRALSIDVAASAVWDAARVRRRLRLLGVRRRIVSLDRPKIGWEAMTDAELRVAQLVADGNTNREIAQKLFVSPHTVNTHLRHVFEKLGVNSRVDVTRMAEQRARSAS